MPLPVPNLDDRTWKDIMQEALARIPQTTPEWTEVNESDPGLAIIDIFAHMTESIIYRLNQLPEKAYLEFLNLIGVDLIPATYARAELRFSLAQALTFDVKIGKGTEVSTIQTETEAPVIYVTEQDLTIPAGQTSGTIWATCKTAGSSGRVGANTLVVIRTPVPYVDSVTNPAASEGGYDAETIQQAKTRGPTEIRNQDRAVNDEDHAELAKKASTDVLRALTLPCYDPAYPGQQSLGHTTVVIMPKGGGTPSQDLITTVRAYLDTRRLTATALHVMGPEYVEVAVTATVAKKPGYTAEEVKTNIESKLNVYLAPENWEWGRDVYVYNLASVIEQAQGVDHIVTLNSPTTTIEIGPASLAKPGMYNITII